MLLVFLLGIGWINTCRKVSLDLSESIQQSASLSSWFLVLIVLFQCNTMKVPFCAPFQDTVFFLEAPFISFQIWWTTISLKLLNACKIMPRVILREQKNFPFVLFSNNSKDFEGKALIVPNRESCTYRHKIYKFALDFYMYISICEKPHFSLLILGSTNSSVL